MTDQRETNARLTRELLEMAKAMHSAGIMPDAVHERIVLRHNEASTTKRPLIRDDS
jgi:hypothetical protein